MERLLQYGLRLTILENKNAKIILLNKRNSSLKMQQPLSCKFMIIIHCIATNPFYFYHRNNFTSNVIQSHCKVFNSFKNNFNFNIVSRRRFCLYVTSNIVNLFLLFINFHLFHQNSSFIIFFNSYIQLKSQLQMMHSKITKRINVL